MDSQMVAFSLECKALMYKHTLGGEKQRVSIALHFRPLVLRLLMMLHAVTYGQMAKCVLYMFCGHIANFPIVLLPEMLQSYIFLILQGSMFYKTCIVAVILSHTHLSVCSVLLTLRAFQIF